MNHDPVAWLHVALPCERDVINIVLPLTSGHKRRTVAAAPCRIQNNSAEALFLTEILARARNRCKEFFRSPEFPVLKKKSSPSNLLVTTAYVLPFDDPRLSSQHDVPTTPSSNPGPSFSFEYKQQIVPFDHRSTGFPFS